MLTSEQTTAALGVLHEAGLLVDTIEFDSQLHRVPVQDKPRGRDGAYIAHEDDPASLWWGNWRTGESGTWTAKQQSTFTAAERKAFARQKEASKKLREAEQTRVHAEAAKKAQSIYYAAADCTGHPYLTAKEVKPVKDLSLTTAPVTIGGASFPKDSLLVPAWDEENTLVSLQYINAAGEKRFLPGGKKSGAYSSVGVFPPTVAWGCETPVLIAEGLATALSLYECLGYPVMIAFDAGNLLPVAEIACRRYPNRKLVICADYDAPSKEYPNPGGIGLAKARAAALAVNGLLAIPTGKDGGKTDWNDIHTLMGAEEVRAQFMPSEPTQPTDETVETEETEQGGSRLLPPPPPVPLGAFPAGVAAMLEEASAFTVAPLQIVAPCFLAFLSCLAGRSRTISIKPGWEESGNLWIASVAPSGMGKTPCMKIFFRVTQRLEYEAKQAFDEAYGSYEMEKDFYQAKRTHYAKDEARGKKVDRSGLIEPEKPVRRRITTDDTTPESLGNTLNENPKGILWLKDELAGLMFDMDKYSSNGGGGTKQRLLSSYDCGPWVTDRASNPARNHFIPKACVGIFGGIQPGLMSKVFEAGSSGMDEASGFLPRFMFIRAVAEAPAYFSERTFSRDSIALLERIAAALWFWDIEYDAEGREIEKVVPVSMQAKALYVKWYNAIAEEAYLAENSALLRKLQAQALRICLLLHSLDAALAETDGMTLVIQDCMRRALLLADWVKEHQEQCWRFFTSEKGTKQANPIERAIMQVIVDEAARIEANGWRISNAALFALVEKKLNMPGLPKEKIGKAAAALGMGKGKWSGGTVRGWSVTRENIESFKASVPAVTNGCRSKQTSGDRCQNEVSPTVPGGMPVWAHGDTGDSGKEEVSPDETIAAEGEETLWTVGTVLPAYNPELDFNDPAFPDERRIGLNEVKL